MEISLGNQKVGDNHPLFFIAEAGVNHNGDINLAKELIDIAVEAKADAVKFQTFNTDYFVTPNTPKVKYQEKSTSPKTTHYEMIKSLELSKEKHQILFDFCETQKIQFWRRQGKGVLYRK